MEAVAERVIALYEENEKRLYGDNKPGQGKAGEGEAGKEGGEEKGKDSEEGARRGYEDLNLAVGFVEHGEMRGCASSAACFVLLRS